MNRSTSFFWTSDTQRVDEFSSDEEEDEEYVLRRQGIPSNSAYDDDEVVVVHDSPAVGSDSGGDGGGTSLRPPLPPPPPTSHLVHRPSLSAEAQPFLYGTPASSSPDYGSQEQVNARILETPASFSSYHTSSKLQSPSPPWSSPKSAWRKRIAANRHLLRLQVVIWYIGQLEVKEGVVDMRFRVTLFWNDTEGDKVPKSYAHSTASSSGQNREADRSIPTAHSRPPATPPSSEWTMKGRRRAVQTDLSDDTTVFVDVPPISILNAVSFEELGGAEVSMIDQETRQLRWTCMYSARVFQADHIRVDKFPHDSHEIKLKIGILADRGRNERWDRTKFPLALATDDDSMGATRIPHGLVVGHVTIPDFSYDPDGLLFEFLPLHFGAKRQQPEESSSDNYLQVTLPVVRLSGHYDNSIMPMMALLNVVAVTCIPRNFSSSTASTETMLSIAFVQVGIRLSIDSRLPSVGYQIKMQRVMNQCFWLLCALVLESNIVFFLVTKREWGGDDHRYIRFLD